MKKLIILALIAFTTTAYAQSNEGKTENIGVVTSKTDAPEILPLVKGKKVKNIIFMIGDGTGIAQITAGQYATVGAAGRLHMQTMPVTGFSKTYSSDNLITDSAAGATAYSCGLKTYNGAIGVDDDIQPCKTILELAVESGLSTGLVATSSVTHATPASFAAHVEKRSMQDEIAAQFLDANVDVFLGGGTKFFSADERKDGRNLMGEFEQAGYQLLFNEQDLEAAKADKMLGLFAKDGFERVEGEPSSAKMTEKALEVLSQNDKGFFLMVEGSQIDWGGHGNDAEYVIREVRDFDGAVKAALDFAQKDGETLVVLTADHETGGMTLQKEIAKGDSLQIYWTTNYHTGTPVPVLAYGPQAEQFMGWRENIYFGRKMAELLNLGKFPALFEH